MEQWVGVGLGAEAQNPLRRIRRAHGILTAPLVSGSAAPRTNWRRVSPTCRSASGRAVRRSAPFPWQKCHWISVRNGTAPATPQKCPTS